MPGIGAQRWPRTADVHLLKADFDFPIITEQQRLWQTDPASLSAKLHLASCKRCRLYKCLMVGINPQGICSTKFSSEQIMAFVERMKEHPEKSAVLKSAPEQKELINLIAIKNLLQIEEKVRRIRYSETPIPELFYTQCDTFESIFSRKLNLIELVNKFSTKPCQPAAIYIEKARQFGPFCIALCSNIAMPLFVLCNSFYSVQKNCDVCVMGMSEKLFCNAIQPFISLKLINEEFVLIRAIIYSHMVSPGLSDQAQKLLYNEAEKYSAVLMSFLQTNYGPAAGALRYVELMGLIECLFNAGAKYRRLLSYISNVLDPNFDKVFPPVLAKIGTKGPVESHQLFPY
ncbi:hypothetical protein niasHT_014975 [Heterodera trifolii]|uniref:NR LBD domain-containing protein n=1 Tax=Heterodera trifolii TaxID=157864 RepID=A0ABD2L4V1_9BILA